MEAHPSSTSDLISSLPKNVIDSILKLLPTRDAIRTSILSRQWRYTWTTFPRLVFTDKQLPELKTNVVKIMDQCPLVDTAQDSLDLLCSNVKTLTLTLNFKDLRETASVLLLIRICPLLQELEIMTNPGEIMELSPFGNYWKMLQPSDYSFSHLKEVRMVSFLATDPELEFTRFLLASADALETLYIRPSETLKKDSRPLIQVLRFQRSSMHASIEWNDP